MPLGCASTYGYVVGLPYIIFVISGMAMPHMMIISEGLWRYTLLHGSPNHLTSCR